MCIYVQLSSFLTKLEISIYRFETSTLSTGNVDLSEHVAHSLQQANYCLKTDEILRTVEVC